ncbi:hypothetical protein EYF80_050159 [Liparis tanakae]|uniref:Uncharacterized protein n=1 Tax=Liparis tanakae TaxID=230148 RepID=A0A4Z2FH46_9TELE|nr:hypothetical protein EYF80_050159 [Liparis tanakae]
MTTASSLSAGGDGSRPASLLWRCSTSATSWRAIVLDLVLDEEHRESEHQNRRELQLYRHHGPEEPHHTASRHGARHIMIPPMNKMAPPIHPTKRAGPKVYLKENCGDPESPPIPPPLIPIPPPLSPLLAYDVNRKLCTTKFAKADTPAMAQIPGN